MPQSGNQGGNQGQPRPPATGTPPSGKPQGTEKPGEGTIRK